MKARVCLKYFVNDCRITNFVFSIAVSTSNTQYKQNFTNLNYAHRHFSITYV